jgi:cytochrome c oxidase cbb3-type subunit 3
MKTLSEMSMEQVVLLSAVGVLFGLVILTLLVLIQLLMGLNKRLSKQNGDEGILGEWYDGLTDAVPISQEETITLNHNYDGIRELDNHLPPWWKYLFYATIVFAVVYVALYHVYNVSPLQTQEYITEVKDGRAEAAIFQAKAANSINESNAKFTTDAKSLDAGKAIFAANCAACHGKLGEGTVGPNLTDDYWLHGAKAGEVFKVIKYGVPSKGMVSWQTKLKPLDIQNVSSYIHSLKGSNPPNGKAPQGELVAEGGAAAAPAATDTTAQAVPADSAAVAAPADSAKPAGM